MMGIIKLIFLYLGYNGEPGYGYELIMSHNPKCVCREQQRLDAGCPTGQHECCCDCWGADDNVPCFANPPHNCICSINGRNVSRCRAVAHRCICECQPCRSEEHKCVCSVLAYDRKRCQAAVHTCVCDYYTRHYAYFDACNATTHKCVCDVAAYRTVPCGAKVHDCSCAKGKQCLSTTHDCICGPFDSDCKSTQHKCICTVSKNCIASDHQCVCERVKNRDMRLSRNSDTVYKGIDSMLSLKCISRYGHDCICETFPAECESDAHVCICAICVSKEQSMGLCMGESHRCVCKPLIDIDESYIGKCKGCDHVCVCAKGYEHGVCLSSINHNCIIMQKDGASKSIQIPVVKCDMIHLRARLRLLIVLKNEPYTFVPLDVRKIIVGYL